MSPSFAILCVRRKKTVDYQGRHGGSTQNRQITHVRSYALLEALFGSTRSMSKAQFWFGHVDPAECYFTHSRIRPVFTGCGKRVEETLDDITQGRTRVQELPLITVINNDGFYFSLNNRRLYVLKQLRVRGLLKDNKVRVRFKSALDREKERYTQDRCSLSVSFLREREHGTLGEPSDAPDEESDRTGEESESETSVSDHAPQPLSTPDTSPAMTQTARDKELTSNQPPPPPPAQPLPAASVPSKQGKGKGGRVAGGGGGSGPPRPLPAAVQKGLKSLAKLADKGSIKHVVAQLDRWQEEGLIDSMQRAQISGDLGVE
jgi:hypothetical protein